MVMRIILKEIDLTKGEGHHHPDIRTDGTNYLALIDGEFHVGPFSEEWYGLNYDGWKYNSLQYDQPGTNASGWQRVWEMIVEEESEAERLERRSL